MKHFTETEEKIFKYTQAGGQMIIKSSDRYLFVMIGISGSGKSTFSERFAGANGILRVSSDTEREKVTGDENDLSQDSKVWTHIRKYVPEMVKTQSVLFDATNTSVKSRKFLVDGARKAGAIPVAIYIDTPLGEAIKRNKARERVVPTFVIKNQSNKLALPEREEFPILIRVTDCDENGAEGTFISELVEEKFLDLYEDIFKKCTGN